jgi:hypothetical protein
MAGNNAVFLRKNCHGMCTLEGIMREAVLTRRLLENDTRKQVKEPCERARDEHEMNSQKPLLLSDSV